MSEGRKDVLAGATSDTVSADVPNSETLEAIAEVEQMKADSGLRKQYTDVDEMMKDLLEGE